MHLRLTHFLATSAHRAPPPDRHLVSAAPARRAARFSFHVPYLFNYTLSLLAAFVVLSSLARAQTVRWEPSGGSLAIGKPTALQLVFEGCQPASVPEIPAHTSLSIKHNGQVSQSSTQTGTGQMTQRIVIGYTVQPSQQNPVTIPAFTIETDKGLQRIPAVRFDVVAPVAGGLDKIALASFQIPDSVWAGEAFPIDYSLSIVRDHVPREPLMDPLNWKPSSLVLEDWSQPTISQTLEAGETRLIFTQRTRSIARMTGVLALDPSVQRVGLLVAGTDPWRTATLNAFAITSDRPTVTVKPLPSGAPAAFNGAVGKFTFESKVVPATANVGDPITWTLTLAGTGNWPDLPGLPAREASKDFRVVQPQAKRTNKDGALFEATLVEDVILIPTKPGTYTLGPVSFVYFDPAKGDYQTVTTPRTTIAISPAPSAVGGVPSPSASGTATPSTASSTSPSAKTLTPPAAPAAIPRDPLPGYAQAPLPLAPRDFLLAALAPLLPLLAFWFILALRRARQTDPLRPQREARARLAATLAGLRTAKEPAKIAALLQTWQRDTAALWPLDRAVPTATDFSASDGGATPPSRTTVASPNLSASSPGSAGGPPASDSAPPALPAPPSSAWSTLWFEAERCLYRSDTPLPADWTARAEAALAARPVKSFSAFSLFLPRNLLPFAAALALALLVLPGSANAQDAAKAAYDRSDFATAEKSWRDQLAKTPTDWIAHHNLALALAQQNRWQEAAAHSATAFVQHPSDASVRWHLALTLDKAGYTPTTISAFINPSPLHDLARRFSPAEWQRIIIAASALAAIALALALLRLHGSRSRALKPAAWTLALVALLVIATGFLSLRLYSPTHDLRASLVWKQTTLRSIPTEADTAQKTTPLAAGSIAVIDKTYLGWSRLAFKNGQTGWVRTEELRQLWR